MYNPYENNQYDQNEHRDAVSPTGAASQSGATPQNGEVTQNANSGVTYHTGPVHTGNAYIPQAGTVSQNQTVQQPYSAPQVGAAPRTTYTWNPSGANPNPQGGGYYGPINPTKRKKPRKNGAGKFALKLLVAVLCCAVVSLGSVGVFAALIQNGVVDVESKGVSNSTTAAFTLYKQAEDEVSSTSTVTSETLTAQEAAKKVTASVVCIQNYQITQQSGYGSFFGYGYDYGDENDSDVSPAGEGSGIIISEDGYIVTNQHVVSEATRLTVITYDGVTYEAELVGEDTQTDLAVIKIDPGENTLTPAEFSSSSDLEVADEVMAIGNPGGMQLSSSVTFGRISALDRQITNSETGYTISCIQTDAAINPGNSGGALADMNGRVVGINSSKIVATDYEGLGFAIPSDTVQPIVSDLIEYGYVKDRPMLGIYGAYLNSLQASFYGVSAGYYVSEVNAENAQNAGLRRGDVITAIDDTQITSSATISNYIANKKPGEEVTLTVDRSVLGEGTVTLTVALSENTGISGTQSGSDKD